jgi:hypothetical protein
MTSIENFRERCQAALPEGVQIDCKLGRADSWGHVFRVLDGRVDAENPIGRVMRILEDPTGSAPWRRPLRQRALKLLGTSLPYVSTLREAGGFSSPAVYLLHDEHPISLDSKISADEGLPPAVVERIVEQLLDGLATLHKRDIAHGDLRLGNVFLSEAPVDGRFCGNVWIGDVATGGLSHWSKGEFMPAMPKAFPPEWGGKPGAPGSKADLYALGVLISQALAGRAVIDWAHETGQDEKPSLWHKLTRQLDKHRILAPKLLFLTKRLLAAEEDRPADAAAVQKELADRRRLRTRGLWVTEGAMSMLVIAALAVVLVNSGNTVTVQAARMSSVEMARVQLEAENIDLKKKMTLLQPYEPVPVSDRAQKAWQEITKGAKTPEDILKRVADRMKASLAAPDRNVLAGWHKEYRNLHDRAEQWFEAEPNIEQLLVQVGRAPWRRERRAEAEARLQALASAAQIWNGWAYRLPDNADLDKELNGRKPEIAEILRGWLDDIRSKHRWTLRLITGTAPKDFRGTFTVLLDASDAKSQHDEGWDDEHPHVFKDRKIDFDWSQSNTIKLDVAYDWSWWKLGAWKYLVHDKEFGGPLAIWQMQNMGQISEGETSLTFEIVDCPGPPRSIIEAAAR